MGKPLTKEHREKIAASVSKTMRRKFLEDLKTRDPSSEPTTKRCPTCKAIKPVTDYGTRKDKRKCGVVVFTPRTECLKCEAKRAKCFKERKIKEGTWEEYVARKEAGRDPAKRRQYHREYATMRRRKEGVKPMNWRKRPADRKERRKATDVPVEPVSVLLEVLEAQGLSREEISVRSGVEARRLYDIRHLATPCTSIDNVDRLLMAFDREEDLGQLYPLKEEESLVGYRILDPEGLLEAIDIQTQA